MNGPCYDPLIARMLSPDNYVQDPSNSQNFNRYSYVMNNPLKYTDPTGEYITRYEDEDGVEIVTTDDGSDDTIVISDEYKEEFTELVGLTNEDMLNDPRFNEAIKYDVLGEAGYDFAKQFTTQWSRQNAIDYIQDPTFANSMAMSYSEAFSQWTDPEKLLLAASIYAGGITAPVRAGTRSIDDALAQSRQFLGKDFRAITNKAGDSVFLSKDGLKKMRFDVRNPGNDAPHVHIEVLRNNKWRDAIPGTHRIYPKR